MEKSSKEKLLNAINNPLLVGLFFSLYAIFVRFKVYPKFSYLLDADFLLIQNFIEWFGVAYGLFIALVLVNVWAQFDTTEREFDKEADAIFLLYESAKQIKETRRTRASTLKGKIIPGIRAYVSHVTRNYLQEHQNLLIREAGDQILDDIRDSIGELVHTNEREPITSELVKRFNEAVDLRGDRISHSKQHIPDPLWGISLASSILWLIPFYGLNFANDWVAIVLVGGVTAIVVAILVIIKDLDGPFEGTWKIEPSEWQLLGEKIGLKPTLFFVYNLDNSGIAVLGAYIKKIVSRSPCALYFLLKKVGQQESFRALAESAYFRVAYKDDIVNFYEADKIQAFPVVVSKWNGKRDVMIETAEINEIDNPAYLTTIIQERLLALRA